MFNFLRKNTALVFIVVVLIIIGFALMDFAGRGSNRRSSKNVAQVGDRKISRLELSKISKLANVAIRMNLPTLRASENPANFSMENAGSFGILMNGNRLWLQQITDDYIYNTLALRDLAKKMGIVPGVEQIKEKIQSIKAFQREGKFDGQAYANFESSFLRSNGLDAADFFKLVSDWISYEKISQILAANTRIITDAQAENLTKFNNEKITAVRVRMPVKKFLGKAEIPEEKLKDHYQKFANRYLSNEKRAFSYARIPFKDEKEKKAASKLTGEFFDAIYPKGKNIPFIEAAKSFKIKASSIAVISADAELNNSEENTSEKKVTNYARQIAFNNLEKSGDIDYREFESNSFVVVKLDKIVQAKTLGYEEAKAQIREELAEQAAADLALAESKKARPKLVQALRKKADIFTAAKKLGFEVDKLGTFSLKQISMAVSQNPGGDAVELKKQIATTKIGQLSQVERSREAADSFMTYILNIESPDPNTEAAQKQIVTLTQNRRAELAEKLFLDCLRVERFENNLNSGAN